MKLSSKRQITIPARMARALGLEPGARLIVRLDGDRIVLTAAPERYTDALAGRLRGVYGNVDEYVREERRQWAD